MNYIKTILLVLVGLFLLSTTMELAAQEATGPGFDQDVFLEKLEYPASLQEKGTEWSGRVKILTDNKGNITHVGIERHGYPGEWRESMNDSLLKISITRAFGSMEITPARDSGKSVEGTIDFVLTFDPAEGIHKRLTDPHRLTARQADELADNPDPNDFIPVEQEASWDPAELGSHVRYPEEALREGTEGMVLLRVLIDRAGKVRKVMVERSDNSIFDEAAIKAVQQTQFSPALMGGQPTATWITVDLSFKMGP